MDAWEKLERVSTFYTAPRQVPGTVLVLCHLGTASGTENAMRQNLWLTQIALMSGTPAFILRCQKSSIRALQNAKQTMEKQAHVQSVGKKQNFFLLKLVFAYRFLCIFTEVFLIFL